MDVVRTVLDQALAAGADHAQARLTVSDKRELNVEWDEPSLLRSQFDRQLEVCAIADQRKAVLRVNDLSPSALGRAAEQVVALARASRPDPANAVADAQPRGTFRSGPTDVDLDAMHARLEEFLAWRRLHHPKIAMRGVHFEFARTETVVRNTNGVDLEAVTGAYQFGAMFSGRQGADVSSFNGSGWQARDLSRPLAERGSVARLLGEAADQIHTRKVGGKFEGDLVVTPDALPSVLVPVTSWLRDDPLIEGTSVFADKLGQSVAHASLTIASRARSDAVAAPAWVTRDGFVADDHTVVEDGVLRSFLLTQYGARKTGGARATSDGELFEVGAGGASLDALVAGVERGVLLNRFSGGRPSDAGDFSGIAKNSFLVEDGKVTYALGETMVSGNLLQLLREVRGISRERVDFGFGVLPWVRFGGVVVS